MDTIRDERLALSWPVWGAILLVYLFHAGAPDVVLKACLVLENMSTVTRFER